MSKMKVMLIAWLIVGAITAAAVITVTQLPQPVYAKQANC
jgi:hypothetical protein